MSVHKPKFKNIPAKVRNAFIRHHLPYELWMMRESLEAAKGELPRSFNKTCRSRASHFMLGILSSS
jgi:hypothetical protein